MRPIIGITSNFGMNKEDPERPQSYLLAGYTDGVFAAGGIAQPVPVPAEYDQELLDELLAHLDGLIFTGGFDLDPGDYGQQPHPRTHVLHPRRSRFELALFRRADAMRKPIFGSCLGHQVAHVARGGQLVQHADDLRLSPEICHHRSNEENAFHEVRIEPDSRLAGIVGGTCVEVASRHHQVVDGDFLGRGLRTVGVSPDGVVEASEDCDGRLLITVQWHPEDQLDRPEHLALFEALVEEAARHRSR
jgi:putative glutamine amidotransferase